MGDQKLGADEIVYDKDKKSGGAETEDEGAPMSNADMQAMWLRRVQTKPADFLRAKFAFQLASGDTAGENSASGDTSREASGQQQGEVPDGSQ